MGFEVVAQRGGLLLAEVGEGRVREDVVGYFGGVSTTGGSRIVVGGGGAYGRHCGLPGRGG
jgi:hypothetical protein